MSQKNEVKARRCSSCGEVLHTNAKGIKSHYIGCAKIPKYLYRKRESNRHPKRPQKEMK